MGIAMGLLMKLLHSITPPLVNMYALFPFSYKNKLFILI